MHILVVERYTDVTVRFIPRFRHHGSLQVRYNGGKSKTKMQKAIFFYCACLRLYHLVSYSLSPELAATACPEVCKVRCKQNKTISYKTENKASLIYVWTHEREGARSKNVVIVVWAVMRVGCARPHFAWRCAVHGF